MKPTRETRQKDQYKRQLTLLEFYVTGRVRQLQNIAKQQPAESAACNMAESELQVILTQILPQMREVKS